MEIFGLSDKGLKRSNNEDSFYINKSNRFAIVADGMGGHQGGEVASFMCTSVMSSILEKQLKTKKENEEIKLLLQTALINVNKEIYERSMSDNNLHGMGSTFSFFLNNKDSGLYLNIGDSRIYLIRNQQITQLTKDDSIVAELYDRGEITKSEYSSHPLRHIITKAVGIAEDLTVTVHQSDILNQDYIVLCSDGLHEMINDEEILFHVKKNKTVRKICKRLVQTANDYGGNDNITVIAIKY